MLGDQALVLTELALVSLAVKNENPLFERCEHRIAGVGLCVRIEHWHRECSHVGDGRSTRLFDLTRYLRLRRS